MCSIIDVKNITKKYGAKTVFEDISFSVKEGSVFGLIGPSGVGKTTLISVLTGQTHLDEGNACIFGYGCEKIPKEIYAQIGIVLDTPALFERLNCYQNLLVYANIWGVDKQRIISVLERVGLQEEMKTRVCQLSKGMKQRLAIGRAILNSPKVLFMDEPTNSLDPSNSHAICELIKEYRINRTTIIIATHRMDEVMELCDHIIILNNHRIAEEGNPYEICCKYDSDMETVFRNLVNRQN